MACPVTITAAISVSFSGLKILTPGLANRPIRTSGITPGSHGIFYVGNPRGIEGIYVFLKYNAPSVRDEEIGKTG